MAGGTYYANYLVCCENHQFRFIYCVTLAYVLYFEEFMIHNSRRFTVFKELLNKSVGVCGVVHAWVGQKHLNCFIFKCFFYRSSLANFHVSA
jgi:hypothetical protein